jgi:hypothetical protein
MALSKRRITSIGADEGRASARTAAFGAQRSVLRTGGDDVTSAFPSRIRQVGCRFLIGLVLALFALGSRDAAAECIVVFESDPIVRLKGSRFVYLAQVTAADPKQGGTATARVVRSWKGSKRSFSWHGAGGVTVGDYYLVFGEADPEVFPYECGNRPLPLAGVHREVTILNRYRGYPRLVVPAPKAKRSP